MDWNTRIVHNRKKIARSLYPCGIEAVLSNESALEYWRLHRDEKINDNSRLRRSSAPISLPHHPDTSIYDAVLSGLTEPFIIIIGSQFARRKTTIFRPRVYTGATPDGCFISIGGGLAVSSPQFCFFQMAAELSLIKLIELGFELCGAYSLPVPVEGDALYDHTPLTGTQALKAFTARMEGVKGKKNALRALRYIANGSGSPMETKLVMLLTLPHQLGGFALPMPVLNKRINLSKADKQRLRISRKAYFKCDLLWPDEGVAVEYDSDAHHSDANRLAADSERRFDLNVIGIDPVTVTRKQLMNPVTFERIARQISKKMGRRWRPNTDIARKAEYELRRQLQLL